MDCPIRCRVGRIGTLQERSDDRRWRRWRRFFEFECDSLEFDHDGTRGTWRWEWKWGDWGDES
jgi:hypothetical protein